MKYMFMTVMMKKEKFVIGRRRKKVIKKKVIKRNGICGDDIKDKLNIKITCETFVCSCARILPK